MKLRDLYKPPYTAWAAEHEIKALKEKDIVAALGLSPKMKLQYCL